MTLHVGMIWAQTADGVIGNGDTIPWHVPEDLAHFKTVTQGHPVIMGRRTWDSLPERFRPLPGRRNIVVTRDSVWAAVGAETVHSIESALALVDGQVWVIGGGQIYRAAMPYANELCVTDIDLLVDGATLAPPIPDGWVSTVGEWQTSRTGIRYRFHRHPPPPT